MKKVAVSGGFDPLHVGHLAMFKEARTRGDHLTVILNNDNWLRKKKGYVFMPQEDRAKIIKALHYVDSVLMTKHIEDPVDMSVCAELAILSINVFANGGDRKENNTPEMDLCKRLGIETWFNVGGEKVESSSELVERAINQMIAHDTFTIGKLEKWDIRPWGKMQMYEQQKNWWAKKIVMNPEGTTSLQSHEQRDETWLVVEGEIEALSQFGRDNIYWSTLTPGQTIHINRRNKHRIYSKKGATLIEIALGNPHESDIIRYQDSYGRV